MLIWAIFRKKLAQKFQEQIPEQKFFRKINKYSPHFLFFTIVSSKLNGVFKKKYKKCGQNVKISLKEAI